MVADHGKWPRSLKRQRWQPDDNGVNNGTGLQTLRDESIDISTSRVPAAAVLDLLPNAVFFMDPLGSITYVNDRLCDLVGRCREDLEGTSALSLIDPRDTAAAGLLIHTGPRLGARPMGPNSLRYLAADGASGSSQFWAQPVFDGDVQAGYLVSFTQESVRDVLATAVNSFAHADSADRVLTTIAGSASSMPLDGIGTILLVEPTAPTDRDRFRVIGDWPIDPDVVNGFGTPWRQCLVRGEAEDIDDVSTGQVDARIGATMAMAGLPSAWIRPIKDRRNETVAVFIVWRRSVSRPSANQDLQVREATRLARLALEQASEQNAIELATHRDPLTGVGSRAALNDRLAVDSGVHSAVFIDLDRFKAINDMFGHDVGDEVIAQVGRRLARCLRSSDDVYRFGGDQFLVVCEAGPNDAEGLVVLGERLADRLSAPYDCERHRVRTSATIGLASATTHPKAVPTLSAVIDAACRAMYVAKDRGRGGVNLVDVGG